MDSQRNDIKTDPIGIEQMPGFDAFSKICEGRPVSAVHAVCKAGAEATVFMLAFFAAAWVAGKMAEQGSTTAIIAATCIVAMVLASALVFASWRRELHGKSPTKNSR